MRAYELLYSSTWEKWSIIFRDIGESVFYVYMEGLSEDQARELSEAMNLREQGK